MKKTVYTALVVSMAAGAPAAMAADLEASGGHIDSSAFFEVEAEPGVEVEAAYVYTGYFFNRGSMVWDNTPTVTPSVGVGFGDSGVSLSAASMLPMANREALAESRDEVDVSMAWGHDVGKAGSVEVGGLFVYLPGAETKHDQEAWAAFGRDFGHGFSASSSFTVLAHADPGMYIEAGFGWEGPVPGDFDLGIGARAGGGFTFGVEDAQLTVLGPVVSLARQVSDRMSTTVDAFYNYNVATDTTLQGVGFGMGWSF